jgi:hypothetical protein
MLAKQQSICDYSDLCIWQKLSDALDVLFEMRVHQRLSTNYAYCLYIKSVNP